MFSVAIDNLKCGGCATTIQKGLLALPGVSSVKIDQDRAEVSVVADEGLRSAVVDALKAMGYPEKGSVHGLESGLATAKSYVSCAIGRFGSKDTAA